MTSNILLGISVCSEDFSKMGKETVENSFWLKKKKATIDIITGSVWA